MGLKMGRERTREVWSWLGRDRRDSEWVERGQEGWGVGGEGQ